MPSTRDPKPNPKISIPEAQTRNTLQGGRRTGLKVPLVVRPVIPSYRTYPFIILPLISNDLMPLARVALMAFRPRG